MSIHTKRRLISWEYQRSLKRIKQLICSKLYQDDIPDVKKSILVAGTARSGTTWIADIIASQLSCRIMFEPFNSQMVKAYSNFNYFQYIRPNEKNDELMAYCKIVFTGQIRDKWIDRRVDIIKPRCRLIKAIRANLILSWIQINFPDVPLFFVMRHPCAVVLSRMKLGWATDSDLEPILAQQRLVDDYLTDKLEVFKQADTLEEKHAIIWCVSNLIPLRQLQPAGLKIIFYEHICTQPEIEIPNIFKSLNTDYQDSVYTQVNKPSITSTSSSAVVTGEDRITNWERKLSTAQVDKILKIVEAFGLDHIYGNSYLPLISESIIH